jgi:hypothetical protein
MTDAGIGLSLSTRLAKRNCSTKWAEPSWEGWAIGSMLIESRAVPAIKSSLQAFVLTESAAIERFVRRKGEKMNTLRAKNLDLAREMNGGHKIASHKLRDIANSCYLSEMVYGRRAISDHQARYIERALSLPIAWLDRDNHALLNITQSEFELLSLLRSLPDSKQYAWMDLLKKTE